MDEKEKQWKWKLIEQIDLKTVKEKLEDSKGIWWNLLTKMDKLEAEYRQFLYLIAINPGKVVVPWSQKLDDFWHMHILDTKKYAHDCENVFGSFIHHNPNLPQGTDAHDKALTETKQMYKDAFEDRKKNKKTEQGDSSPGCGACFIGVFCGTACGGGHGASCSSGAASCSSGGSCGSSCSSCGGGGCGGGGD